MLRDSNAASCDAVICGCQRHLDSGQQRTFSQDISATISRGCADIPNIGGVNSFHRVNLQGFPRAGLKDPDTLDERNVILDRATFIGNLCHENKGSNPGLGIDGVALSKTEYSACSEGLLKRGNPKVERIAHGQGAAIRQLQVGFNARLWIAGEFDRDNLIVWNGDA